MTIKIVVKKENQGAGLAGEVFTLADLLINIGSANASTVRLSGDGVAPEQAVIINENGQLLLVNQALGTFLNGREIEQGVPNELKNNDLIKIGSYYLTIKLQNQHLNVETSAADNNNKLLPNKEYQVAPNGSQALLAETADQNKLEVGTFADILSSLRKDEDQFYFQVTEPDGAKRRLPIESDEIILGWNEASDFFSTAQETVVDQPQAVIRKDWSGVTIYPNGNEAILLNEALLEAGTRLRNGDKLVFSRRLVEATTRSVTLVFCEPAALIELNAILPQELLSNALETNRSGEITVEPELEESRATKNIQPIAGEARGARTRKERNSLYFGYFTLADIIILVVGTILTTALTYILLEFA